MKVVVIDADVSYPPTSGKRLRTLNLLLPLAREHSITYIGRLTGDDSTAPAARQFFRDHGIEPVFVHHPLPRKSGLRFYARLAANLVSTLPYSVSTHLSRPLREAAARVAERADLWHLEWPMLQPLVPTESAAPRVVVAHNVESQIWRRYVESTTNPFKKLFLDGQRRKFESVEGRELRRADRVIAVSDEDAAAIRLLGQPRVDVVDNGVDPEYFASVEGPHDPATILFLGALDWRPNQDALDLLLSRVFPEVRRQVPQARLLIVGRHPSPALVNRAANMAGIELHADVPDVRPYLGRAGVMAVPLRIGGGSRLKILEALASGVPVVSTRVGAEGLRLVPGEHFVEADGDALAAALVHACRNPTEMMRMAESGRTLVRARYDWRQLALKLDQSWQAAAARTREAGACASSS